MANKVNAFNGSELLVRIGDGASPETFTHPCIINTNRGIEFTANMTESTVPYCPPDDNLPAWVDRVGDGLSATITGAGIAHTSDIEDFSDWFVLQLTKNLQVAIASTFANDGYWEGAGVLQRFAIVGPSRREKSTFDCTILSTGAWKWHQTT